MASISDNPDVGPFRGTSKEEREESGQAKSRGRRLLAAEHLKIGYEVDGQLHIAVEDVSFEVWPNEKVMLIGPSGCGKSTLLKTVAGFLQPVGGSISIAGRDSLEPGPDRAVVFQEFDQLFPWRTVIDNVVYPLRVVGRGKDEAAATAKDYLEMMGLSHAAERFPHQLSGGMKQRVAIARALALDPLMLLMDEPFGALDALTRQRLQMELNDIAEKTQVTILFVTHSIQEALVLGERIVVLGQAPSRVEEVVDVSATSKDPEDEEFIEVQQHLRALLGVEDKGEEAKHAGTE
jgi:NitT/TauT family transport system ATP-binding protein